MTEEYARREELVKLLNQAIAEAKTRGRTLAKSERDYRVALAQKILIERTNGTPVTIINDLCRGDEKVAGLKFERDTAQSLYDSALEAINVYKLQLKVIQDDIQNERRGM